MSTRQICGDLHSNGQIWRARDQSLHRYSESSRLCTTAEGLLWQTLPSNTHTNKNEKTFATYVKRFQNALSLLPAWNFRFEQRNSCLRLHGDRGQWQQLLPWWRMSWSLSSDGLGTQIGALATYAARPPFAQWLNYLRLLDAAKPSETLTAPQQVHFQGSHLIFSLEDSLSHAANKLTQHGSWRTQYPVMPSCVADPPEWWDALVPNTMLFCPRHTQVLARDSAWFAVAYLRERHRLIVADRLPQPTQFAVIELGEPLHRFMKHLTFAPLTPQTVGTFLKGVQWVLPDALLSWPGVDA